LNLEHYMTLQTTDQNRLPAVRTGMTEEVQRYLDGFTQALSAGHSWQRENGGKLSLSVLDRRAAETITALTEHGIPEYLIQFIPGTPDGGTKLQVSVPALHRIMNQQHNKTDSKTDEALNLLNEASSEVAPGADWRRVGESYSLTGVGTQTMHAIQQALAEHGIDTHYIPAEDPNVATGDAFPSQEELQVSAHRLHAIMPDKSEARALRR
jgi:hypothetical protein